mmetsp:Transcript_13194/g.44095  ORF Transcript_13194/g.44095 Transcript_13194/m.44095 type:complete len:389 (+) Transcript_13194:64-1230(+)
MGFLKNSKPALKPTHVLVPLSSHGLDLETAEVMARKDGLSQGTCAKCLRLCVYKIQHEALTGLQTTAREALVVAAELGIVEIKNPQSGPGDLPGRCMLNWDLLHKKMPNFLEWALPKVPVAADTAVVVGVLQQGIERVEESIADVAKRQSVVLLRMEEGFEQSKKGLAEQFEQSVNRATMLLLKSAQKQHEKIVEALTPGATTEDHTVAALRRAFTLQNEVEVAQAQERDLGAVMVSPRRLSYKAQVRFSPCSQGSLALSSSEVSTPPPFREPYTLVEEINNSRQFQQRRERVSALERVSTPPPMSRNSFASVASSNASFQTAQSHGEPDGSGRFLFASPGSAHSPKGSAPSPRRPFPVTPRASASPRGSDGGSSRGRFFATGTLCAR